MHHSRMAKTMIVDIKSTCKNIMDFIFTSTREICIHLKFIFKGLFTIAITMSLLTFAQRQEPIFNVHMNHNSKIMTIENESLPPISVTVFSVKFGLNWNVDEHGHQTMSENNAIDNFSTLGFISKNVKIWSNFFLKNKTEIDLNSAKFFSFFDKNDNHIGESIYCVIVDARNLLSNQRNLKAVLTSEIKFPSSIFGPQDENSGEGGGYAAAHKYWDIEDQIKKSCLRAYENFS
jgi:hypothetical protein